jgi:hypothetical protein
MASADRWKKKQPAPDAREASFGPGQLARALRTYVVRPDTLPAVIAEGARPILPGLVMVPAVERGDEINFLPPSSVADLGGADALLLAGRDNLRQLDHLTVARERVVERAADTEIVTVAGNDPFVASRVADLMWVLGQLEGGGQPLGTLVSVPVRTRLHYHVVRGPGVLRVASDLALVADHLFAGADENEAVSPQVWYIAADGRCQSIVRTTPDGKIAIDADGLLADLLHQPPPAGLGLRG